MLNPENPFKLYENSKLEICTEKIKEKLSLMKNHQFCTSNYRIIKYFEENNFQPLIKEDLMYKILKEYNNNPNKFILPNNKGNYKSEKFFKKSIRTTISNNKIFMQGPYIGQLSLNLEKAQIYLDSIYKKYDENTKNIMSPNKKPKNKNNKKKDIENVLKKNIKGKYYINNQDEIPIEVEEYNEKQISNNKPDNEIKDKIINSIESTAYFGIKKEKNQENNENNIIISNINKIKKRKENKNLFPEIFFKNIHLNNISSLHIKSIKIPLDSFNNLLLLIQSKKKKDINEKDLEKIKISLQEIKEKKITYNKNINELFILKKDIFNIFKLMDSQLKSIIILIESPNYRYELYIDSQNLLLNYGTLYNKAVDKFKSLLLDLRKFEKKIIDNCLIIKNLLNNFNNSIYFSELEQIFAQNLQIDISTINNSSHYDIMDDVINEFNKEKNKIIYELKKIDDLVGNIKIY